MAGNNVLKVMLFIIAFAFTTARPASAENYCKTFWAGYVSKIQADVSFFGLDNKAILFSGPDGQIHDCLDLALSRSAMRELQFWSTAITPSIILLAEDTSSVRSDYCNLSTSSVQETQIMFVHLPYDPSELSAEECQVRLRGLTDRVSDFLQR